MKTFRNKNKESELRKTFEKNKESKERMRESSSIFYLFCTYDYDYIGARGG